ncbi:hypothetical protein [Pedococcus soli]
MSVKSLSIGAKVATIKINTDYFSGDTEARAIYALLGGYNEVARGVDITEFQVIQRDFRMAVNAMKAKLNHQDVMARHQ